MPESALGRWLRAMRDARDLSLRDVAQRSGVDHAYIYRLETGAKESPSDDVIDKLTTALGSAPRDAEILKFLALNTNVDPSLAEFAVVDPTVTPSQFQMLTTVVNRGAKADYATSLARIRRFMDEEDEGDG
ncbi:helix-turn-helix transcriptional regulator [Brevundimonas sp.]|uniref:helix-turn-helix domain-containing protein n=1 Tax=Brevundimonas sp. TaxID=1871086 RepID=UPI002D4C1FD8|nr:helix-turn-helix transcriptional regulator [Brevundimonas sp.]HYC97071.1 helix-turn-helix transcriptional regulator [Brevundimonas sp.]